MLADEQMGDGQTQSGVLPEEDCRTNTVYSVQTQCTPAGD